MGTIWKNFWASPLLGPPLSDPGGAYNHPVPGPNTFPLEKG